MELDYEKYANNAVNDPNDNYGTAEMEQEMEKMKQEDAARRQCLKELWKGASKEKIRKKVEKWQHKQEKYQIELDNANEKVAFWKEVYDENYPWGKST